MLVRGALLVLALSAAWVPQPVFAQVGPDANWACWYPGGHQINCVLIQAATDLGGTGLEVPEVLQASSPGRPLPDTVKQVQGGSADLYGQVVRIPLMSEPYDTALVHQLARFTVCGSALTCTMTFTRSFEEVVMLQSQDPLLR